jgi:hypothetical protein
MNAIKSEVKRVEAERTQFVRVEDAELAEVLPEDEALEDVIARAMR